MGWLERAKNLIPFERNWSESNKNKNLPERNENFHESSKNMNTVSVIGTKNWYESCKDMGISWLGKSKGWVEEEVRAKGISDEHKDLLIKGSGALLLAPTIGYKDGLGSACRFLLSYVASENNCCEMAKDMLEKSESWAEGEIRTKGINVENLDLLIKAGGTLLISPVIGYCYGTGSACAFILKCAASNEDCREMAINRFEKSTSWVGMAKNKFEMSKSWAEEKIRGSGISDEHRDLVLKGGGALFLAAVLGYYGGFLGGACGFIFKGGSSNDDEKLMKAPGRPGEFIARAAFEANPRSYFRALRGKHP